MFSTCLTPDLLRLGDVKVGQKTLKLTFGKVSDG